MPRLSLWNPRKGNDYKFIDKMVKGHFEHGGTALLVHKYIGSVDENDENYDPANPPIQDLLFMEIVIENMRQQFLNFVVLTL